MAQQVVSLFASRKWRVSFRIEFLDCYVFDEMRVQEGGWPLGLQPLNARVGVVRNRGCSGSASFSTLLTGSPTSTADTSSDLDTEVSCACILWACAVWDMLNLRFPVKRQPRDTNCTISMAEMRNVSHQVLH